MSDDLRDTFGDDIFLEGDEDEVMEGEGGEAQNRTFYIIAAILGGLLFVAVAAFVVWAFIINPRTQNARLEQQAAIVATNEAIAMMADQTEEPTPTPEPTEEETETPEVIEPTETPVVKPTPTATPTTEAEVGGAAEGDEEAGDEGAALTATPRPTRTPVATPTPRVTPTKGATTTAAADATPDTGLGELVLVIAAALLIGMIAFARRLRKA